MRSKYFAALALTILMLLATTPSASSVDSPLVGTVVSCLPEAWISATSSETQDCNIDAGGIVDGVSDAQKECAYLAGLDGLVTSHCASAWAHIAEVVCGGPYEPPCGANELCDGPTNPGHRCGVTAQGGGGTGYLQGGVAVIEGDLIGGHCFFGADGDSCSIESGDHYAWHEIGAEETPCHGIVTEALGLTIPMEAEAEAIACMDF